MAKHMEKNIPLEECSNQMETWLENVLTSLPFNEFISQQTLTATLCVLRGCIFVYAYENHSWALHYLDS